MEQAKALAKQPLKNFQVADAGGPKQAKKHENWIGEMPENDLGINPSAEDGYRTPQYATFVLTNLEENRVAYRLRTRDRLFPQFSHSHGFLDPLEQVEVVCFIPSYDQWPRDLNEYTGKVHRIVVESLVTPEKMYRPENPKDAVHIVRRLFHNTATRQPLTRLYFKLKIILPLLTAKPAPPLPTNNQQTQSGGK